MNAEPSISRRLAAILAADIAGYSRLMGQDEAATVNDLKGHQAVILPLVGRHSGRIIDTAGDGILAEFPSVIGATECAIEIQTVMAARNEDVPEHRRMLFRIGINLGDVIHDETRIYGDGINVAARLEGLAEPAGVLVSQAVHDQVQDRLDLAFDDLGECELKNIARPVRVYRVRSPVEAGPTPRRPSNLAPQRSRRWMPAAVTAAAVVLAVAGGWFWSQRADAPKLEAESASIPSKGARLAAAGASDPQKSDHKSIAVLAFENLGGEKDNEYFSDGMSDILLNLLGKVPGLRVAGRTSAFAFKGKHAPVAEIAQKLGVAYVLDGSVQKSGTQVRITARLISAADGFQVWSDGFTRELKDVFAMQDEIASAIAQKLQLKLGHAVREAKVVDEKAHLLVLEGVHFWNLRTEAGFVRAEDAYTRALKIDANFAEAHAGLATLFKTRALFRVLDATDAGAAAADEARAWAEAQIAKGLDPTLPDAYAAIAFLQQLQGNLKEAGPNFEKALALRPNFSSARSWYGRWLSINGQLDAALEQLRFAFELDPFDFNIVNAYAQLLALSGRFAEALELNEKAADLRRPAIFIPNLGDRALMLLALGRKTEALKLAREILNNDTLRTRWTADADAIWVLRKCDLPQEADSYAEKLLRTLPEKSYVRGFVLAHLDRFDEALPYLERTPMVVQREMFWLRSFDTWRDDPRFKQLMAKLGRTEEYKIARASMAQMLKEQKAKI